MRRTSGKAAWASFVFLVVGMTVLMHAEAVTFPSPFSPAGEFWNNWHYFSIGLFALSTALFLVWYWFAAKND
jgi:hypothetical protein